jgi:DNA-binding response OmpR family regulator
MTANVLIVEDEQHLADGLRFNLEAEGYCVETIADGETALEKLSAGDARYEAVVLDVMLPGIDGFHRCRRTQKGRAIRAHPHADGAWSSRRRAARLRGRRRRLFTQTL